VIFAIAITAHSLDDDRGRPRCVEASTRIGGDALGQDVETSHEPAARSAAARPAFQRTALADEERHPTGSPASKGIA